MGCWRRGFHLNFTKQVAVVASESSLSMSVMRMEEPVGRSGDWRKREGDCRAEVRCLARAYGRAEVSDSYSVSVLSS